MGEALQTGKLEDEALAFVTGSPTRPNAPQPLVPTSEPRNDSHLTTSPPPIAATVSMSFRLPARLAARLVEVAVQRKLQRARPFSQQDIVAEALAAWFRSHGFSE